MTDGDALSLAILVDPHADQVRLEYADYLTEHDGEMDCERCHGARGYLNPRGGYREFSGAYETWEECGACGGTGRVPNRHAERGELIRVSVEIEKRGDERIFCVCDRSTIPDGHEPGCLWRKHYDANFRERELIQVGQTAGWWKIEGLEGPVQIRGGDLVYVVSVVRLVPSAVDPDGEIIVTEALATVRRGFIAELALPAQAFTPWLMRGVLERHPVERVAISDAEVSILNPGTQGRVFIHRDICEGLGLLGVYEHLELGNEWSTSGFGGTPYWHLWWSREAALSALSAACVSYARSLVTLPGGLPLPPLTVATTARP